ncbi:MAG: hypothetical protein PVF85_10680 [Anaerolineales bacterium]|jgi:hypothetical protein
MPRSKTLTTNAVSIPADENQEGMPSWDQVARTFPERFPLSFRWTALLITLIVIGEQILEEYLVGPVEGYAFWQRLGVRFALPLLSIYLLLSNRFLKREVVKCLQLLKPSMQIPFEVYDRLARAMLKPRRLIEAALLLISSSVVLGFFVVMENPLPIYTLLTLPDQPIAAGYIIAVYILIGWLGLSLVYTGVQHAMSLSNLSRQPLSINVFDPENVVPFGIISMQHSIVLAGVVVILFLLLGRPTSLISYLVIILASLGSFLALVLPLIGVYQQMRRAKIKALGNIAGQLLQAQDALMNIRDPFDDGLDEINARTSALVNLRKTILESPNWPFRSNTAIARAVIAALSPLIYFVLTELVREYIVPLLIG